MRSTERSRKILMRVSLVMLAGISLVLSACSGSSSTASSTAKTSGGLTNVTISITPGTDTPAMYLAQSLGFFKKYGLNVKIVTNSAGGSISIPQVLSGQSQFGYVGVTDFAEALAKGFPLKVLGPFDATPLTPNNNENSQVITLPSSGITSVGQLGGKTVAVNSLGGVGQLYVDAAVKNAGGDWKAIKYVAVQWADAGTALEAKNIDAAWVANPSLVELKQQQPAIQVLAQAPSALGPNIPQSGWVTSASYYAAHPAVVKEFHQAMDEAVNYTQSHPDAARANITQIVGTPASVTNGMALANQSTTVSAANINSVITQLKEFDLFTGELPPVSSWFLPNSALG